MSKKHDITTQMLENNKSSINENMTEVESILNAILKCTYCDKEGHELDQCPNKKTRTLCNSENDI